MPSQSRDILDCLKCYEVIATVIDPPDINPVSLSVKRLTSIREISIELPKLLGDLLAVVSISEHSLDRKKFGRMPLSLLFFDR
mmetsp:Transcript_6721/g.14054  ORF Transcript_6721/g.14054 Transcript_6721/m.14054 type:complete len:83 (+) Transcript_6721:828-1076(+)